MAVSVAVAVGVGVGVNVGVWDGIGVGVGPLGQPLSANDATNAKTPNTTSAPAMDKIEFLSMTSSPDGQGNHKNRQC